MVSFKQHVFPEVDQNKDCMIYPTDKYNSYDDCDQQFLADLLKNERIYPAWATQEDLNKATNITYKTFGFFFGDMKSSCKDPCTVTSIQSLYSVTEFHSVKGGGLPSLWVSLNPVVEVTWHVFPSYGIDLILLDLGSSLGFWLGLSVTHVLEMAVMAMATRIRNCLEASVIKSWQTDSVDEAV